VSRSSREHQVGGSPFGGTSETRQSNTVTGDSINVSCRLTPIQDVQLESVPEVGEPAALPQNSDRL